MNLSQMREQLNGLAGLDLEPEEADQLLNEGYQELTARAEWSRVYYTDTTVADQEDYTLPANLYRILDVQLSGIPQYLATDEEIAHIRAGNLIQNRDYTGSNLYWLEGNSSGVDHLTLYPTPTDAGNTILLIYVSIPAALEDDDDTPVIPSTFHRAIVNYAAARAYELLEDDKDLADRHTLDFETGVERLRRLRYSRKGRGATQLRVSGTHY